MMRHLSSLIIYILFFTLFGCSQKFGINKSYAFTRTITAGNIPVDNQNRPQSNGVSRAYLIYLEVEDTISKPRWDTAWINNLAFSVEPLKIERKQITIGKTANEQKTISLSSKDGYVLWQLLLTPISNVTQSGEIQAKEKKPDAMLIGYWNGEEVKYRIKEIIELERLFME